MIPAEYKDDLAQDLRDIFIETLFSSPHSPVELDDDDNILIVKEVDDFLNENNYSRTTLMLMISEWFNDMDHLQYRASFHDDDYDLMLFVMLGFDEGKYCAQFFALTYPELFDADEDMTIKDYIQLNNVPLLQYPLSFEEDDFSQEENQELLKTVRSVIRELMLD